MHKVLIQQHSMILLWGSFHIGSHDPPEIKKIYHRSALLTHRFGTCRFDLAWLRRISLYLPDATGRVGPWISLPAGYGVAMGLGTDPTQIPRSNCTWFSLALSEGILPTCFAFVYRLWCAHLEWKCVWEVKIVWQCQGERQRRNTKQETSQILAFLLLYCSAAEAAHPLSWGSNHGWAYAKAHCLLAHTRMEKQHSILLRERGPSVFF